MQGGPQDAEALLQAARAAAEAAGVTAAISVVDAGGHLLAFGGEGRAVLIAGEAGPLPLTPFLARLRTLDDPRDRVSRARVLRSPPSQSVFVMRPLGGAIGGYFADKLGRKPVLVTAMIVMGGATFLIGMLPTYEQVGGLAPILLVSIRMLQGLAFGAEWGGAITMAYEHAPWHRRGMFAAIPQSGNPLGIALASGVFAWSDALDGA
ncbi:MFS transporter [Streptomyces hygroscopicus]|uniref:MFS transporter n=1 Tax=Streptomyces hygroscopicus TaxID=1912 RepID=UPI00369C953A